MSLHLLTVNFRSISQFSSLSLEATDGFKWARGWFPLPHVEAWKLVGVGYVSFPRSVRFWYNPSRFNSFFLGHLGWKEQVSGLSWNGPLPWALLAAWGELCETLVQLLEVKLTKACHLPWLGLPGIFLSQACLLWASSNYLIALLVSIPSTISNRGFSSWILVPPNLGTMRFYFSYRSKKSCWLFYLFSFLLTVVYTGNF